MSKEKKDRRSQEELNKDFTLPQLPPYLGISGGFDPIGGHEVESDGLGDDVERMLFDLKGEAIFIQHKTDLQEINGWMRTELEAMLQSAREKKDQEFIGKFENAIARLSRFNQ